MQSYQQIFSGRCLVTMKSNKRLHYSDTHLYVTYSHLCANQRFIGCRNKGFFCSVVGKI